MSKLNDIIKLIEEAVINKASDIHLTENRCYKYRVDGVLIKRPEIVIAASDMQDFFIKHSIAVSSNMKSYDCALTVAGTRLRMNYYRSNNGMEVALRILSDKIPEFEELNLAPSLRKLISMRKGLVLITGVTGSGKTTTIASIVNAINRERQEHILTIEAPIEYIFEEAKCKISQREVPTHTPSFMQATIDAMREDPDIIFLGEMRDRDTMSNATTLAETGHLVLATLHCRNPAEAVDRIVDTYPPEQQSQARSQVCNVVECIVSQSLVKRTSGGRYCLQEIMFVNDAVRNALRENKGMNTIRSNMVSNEGSVTIEESAVRGVKDFDVAPLEMWSYMGSKDIVTFRTKLEKANIEDSLLQDLDNVISGNN